MRKTLIILILFAMTVSANAEITNQTLQMSLQDTFTIKNTAEWNVAIEKMVTLRFADISVKPKYGYDFDMELYFKCDTPDLAQFDSPEKIKDSITESSKRYLPYVVEKEIKIQKMNIDNSYGYCTVLTDLTLSKQKNIANGEFLYMTRGMVRLSKDSALGFSIMTNEVDTELYSKLFKYILSFVKK